MTNSNKKKSTQQIKTKAAIPKKERPLMRVVIREELFALTKDPMDAVLLGQLIYWHWRTSDKIEYVKEEAARLSNPNNDLKYGWIYKSGEDMGKEVMLGLKEDAVRTRLKKMIDKGWISRRKNPTFKWDQKWQYRVNLMKVNDEIKGLLNEDGENAGYYLSCDVMDAALTYIPRTSGMEPNPERAVQPDHQRDEAQTTEIKNREGKIFDQSSFSSSGDNSRMTDSERNCDASHSSLRTKEELISEAERSYDGVLAHYKNDGLVCAEDFQVYKSAELEAMHERLEDDGVEGEELQQALQEVSASLSSFDDEIVDFVNSKKAKWLESRRVEYIDYITCNSVYMPRDGAAIRDMADAMKSKHPDRDMQYWFDVALLKIDEKRKAAKPK